VQEDERNKQSKKKEMFSSISQQQHEKDPQKTLVNNNENINTYWHKPNARSHATLRIPHLRLNILQKQQKLT